MHVLRTMASALSQNKRPAPGEGHAAHAARERAKVHAGVRACSLVLGFTMNRTLERASCDPPFQSSYSQRRAMPARQAVARRMNFALPGANRRTGKRRQTPILRHDQAVS
jgi:hypothetical protein